MKVIRRYLSSEITASILLVFAALLMLFAFLDLIHELGELGKGNYRLPHIIAFVLLSNSPSNCGRRRSPALLPRNSAPACGSKTSVILSMWRR